VGRPRELELRRYLRSQRHLAAQLLGSYSLEQVSADFISTVASLLRWEAGALWEVGQGAERLEFVSGWSHPGLDAEPLWRHSRELSVVPGGGLPGRAWASGEIAWAPDFAENPDFPRGRTAATLGLESALAIPVPIGPPEGVLAVAEFHTGSVTTPSEELLVLLRGFVDQLATFVVRGRAEAETRSGEQFRAAVLASSLDSIIAIDQRGIVIEFSRSAERLFAYSREQAVGRELAELIVPPELRERHREGLRRYLETGESSIIGRRVELPAQRSDGTQLPVELTVTRIKDTDPPAFTGFLRDISERGEVEEVRNHLAEVVKGTQDAVLSKDLDGVIASWNPAAERLYGYTAEDAIGRHVSFLMPDERKHEEREILDRVRRRERLATYETQRVRKDGAVIDVSLTVSPIESANQGLVGASVVARDVTGEKRARRARDFLAAASRDFDASLDPAETARNIVETAVPELAELCVIDFLREDGLIGDSVVAAAEPGVAATLEEIRRHSPLAPDGEHPAATVLREGRPMIWRDLKAPEVVDRVVQSKDHRRLMEAAGYNSAAVVPLVARGRQLGALSFLHARKNLRYDAVDLEFLAELGARAAMALDNARLFRERDLIASNLQRGLRPPRPPQVAGLEIAVFFEAAGRGIEIGGDLYDVLPTEDGCWILIGDVAGKGSAAAGVSVALRHSVADPRGGRAGGDPRARQRTAPGGDQPQRLRHGDPDPAPPRAGRLAARPGRRRPPAGDSRRAAGPGAARWRIRAGSLGGGAAASARGELRSGRHLGPLHRWLARGRADRNACDARGAGGDGRCPIRAGAR
jgi:PAS domain S-box-containing protein